MDGTDLKHFGESSPALAEFRSHRQQQWGGSPSQLLDAMGTVIHPSVTPQTTAVISTPSVRTGPIPQQGSGTTPECSLARALYAPRAAASLTVKPKTPLQLQSATPEMKGGQGAMPQTKGGQSAPAKLHATGLHLHPAPQSEANTKHSDTDITTVSHCTAGRNTARGHPLVTSSKPESSVSSGPRQGHVSGCPKPSGQRKGGEFNPPSVVDAAGSNINPQSDDSEIDGKSGTSAGSSEETRKLRQAQQRLQKEKWQKKYGLGCKRHSEGSVGGGSFREQEPHNKGQTVDEDGFNGLISDGKVLLCFALHSLSHSTHGSCVAGNMISTTYWM